MLKIWIPVGYFPILLSIKSLYRTVTNDMNWTNPSDTDRVWNKVHFFKTEKTGLNSQFSFSMKSKTYHVLFWVVGVLIVSCVLDKNNLA